MVKIVHFQLTVFSFLFFFIKAVALQIISTVSITENYSNQATLD